MYVHRYLLGQLRRIYFMALPEGKEDFKKSRICYTTADTAAQTISQLAGGTFLATLMSYCKISDANIGIITSLVRLAALSQLFLINFFKKLKKSKPLSDSAAFCQIGAKSDTDRIAIFPWANFCTNWHARFPGLDCKSGAWPVKGQIFFNQGFCGCFCNLRDHASRRNCSGLL